MSRKQKKKDAREQSTRQLMGIDDITDYGIATRMGELVFFAIKPTNISVLPDTGVGARIYALLNVVKGMAEIEMLALNSKESFENNKAFYRQRANEEELPVIRKLLEQDSKHLDRIQVLMASSREFYILVRLQGKKESDVFSYLSRIEKSIKDIRLYPETRRQMDSWLEESNSKNRNEFVEKALRFYMGYLGTENITEYLSDALVATLRGIIADSTNRTNGILFKCAVEQGIMAHTIAAHFRDTLEDRRALRGYVVDEVKRTNGQIRFEDAQDVQRQLPDDTWRD